MARRINPFQPVLDKLPGPLKNKYFLTLAVFFFVIIFVNKVNPITQLKLQGTKTELEGKKKYYKQKLEEVAQDRVDNERHVEKFAREHYYMKKKVEDVFVIVEEEREVSDEEK
jgi:hypothetical protein